MVEEKLKKIGEILDNIAKGNHKELKKLDSEIDRKRRKLDKKHEKIIQRHKHLDKRHSLIKQRQTNLNIKEKQYNRLFSMKKGLDNKSKRLAKQNKELVEKRKNISDRITQEKIKIQRRYLEKEKQLKQFMRDLESKDKKLNRDIITLEVERIKLLKSLSRKKKPERLVPAGPVDLWPLKIAVGLQKENIKEFGQILKDMPNTEFIKEFKKANVKKI